jgi:hypothetical protein
MPNTRLILHVKGTQAETAELPKDVVRAAISEGQLTHSQLIWIPAENAWKQVRELPDLLPSERLILHVKGTEAQTKELPKQEVRAAISQGQITHSQLIWSPRENTWKQVRELPDLLPSQKLAPAPSRAAVAQVSMTTDAIIPESPTGPVARAVSAAAASPPRVHVAVTAPPKVRVASVSADQPQVRVASVPTGTPQVRVASVPADQPQVRVASVSAGQPQVRVASVSAGQPQVRVATVSAETPTVRAATPVVKHSAGHFVVKEEDEGSHPVKWVCIGLGILILFVLGGNYFMVDQPLVSNLSQTAYSNVTVYAHYGAFMQPNVIVIHIPASATLTPDNLTDFLVTLAHSTPQNPITRDLFERVALTTGWTAQYSFSGYTWKELRDMGHDDVAQRKEFLMAQMCDAGGQPLMPESTLNEEAQQAARDQVWETFVTHFTAKR